MLGTISVILIMCFVAFAQKKPITLMPCLVTDVSNISARYIFFRCDDGKSGHAYNVLPVPGKTIMIYYSHRDEKWVDAVAKE